MAALKPAHITIGTAKAFARGYQYEHSYHEVLDMYVCNKGSESAREGEVLVLRSIAWDTAFLGGEFRCRQPVFRSTSDIPQAGWHVWEINYAARQDNEEGMPTDWQGNHWQVETRHPPAQGR